METFIATALVGVLVGILSGLLGIGGGTVMVPVFRLGFGLSAFASTATSLFTIIPTSLVGFVTHIRNKTCIPKLGVVAGLGGAITSPIGVYLANISPAWLVMLAAAVIIGYSSYTMFRKAIRMPKAAAAAAAPGQGAESPAQAAPESAPATEPATETGTTSELQKEAAAETFAPAEEFSLAGKRLPMAIGIGLAAGLASGYVGVGGGFIMVPMFVSLLGVMMRQASGTSLIAVTILVIPGVIEQGMLGNIDYLAGIAMAVGSIPGAVIGANLIRRVPERLLRFIFGAFLLLSAIVLLANELATL